MASRLPVEVVTHIMSFLDISDRKEMSLVCRAWYEASLDPVLQDNIIVNITCEKTEEILKTFYRRRLTHLILSHFDNASLMKNVIVRACELGTGDLHSLSLKDSNITESVLLQLLSYCPRLTCLDLSGCNSLFMSGTLFKSQMQVEQLQAKLNNVKELNLSSVRYLSDCLFNRIVLIFSSLQKLVLASTQMIFNGHAYYSSNAAKFENSAVFTFCCLKSYLQLSASRIKGLDLSHTTIGNQHLGQLAQIKGLQLEELLLIGCRDIGNEGIVQLSFCQTLIKHLDISSCLELADTALDSITKHLTVLQTLHLHKCRMLTDSSITLLKNLDHLRSLDLSECYEVTSNGMLNGICMGSKVMTQLNLSCCSKLDTTAVVKLTQCLPLLQHLDLGSCFLLQDSGLHVISGSLRRLRSLRLAWCTALTDLGLLGLKPDQLCSIHEGTVTNECSCTKKSHTPIIFQKPTGEERVQKEKALQKMIFELKAQIIPQSLNALVNLHSLDLSSCPKFTDLGLQGALKFSELRILKLNCIHDLTGLGLTEIAINNPGLEELQLKQCGRITDSAIDAVTSRCQRLSHLDISNCDGLTDTALIHIGDNCQRLRMLDVSFCCGLSPQAVEQLEERLKTLTTLLRRSVGVHVFSVT